MPTHRPEVQYNFKCNKLLHKLDFYTVFTLLGGREGGGGDPVKAPSTFIRNFSIL